MPAAARIPGAALVIALVLAGCAGETSAPAPTGSSGRPSTSGQAQPLSGTAGTTEAAGDRPVVDLFYAVHVHCGSEWSPFRDPELAELDLAEARGYVDHVGAIAGTLELHGARGSFHFTFGTATGLCEFDPGFLDDLEARGHEIGIHAHSDQFMLRSADAMRRTCGRDIGTGSGLITMAGGPGEATRASLGTSLQVLRDVGATQLLVNLSGECGTTSVAGNAPTPWRATPGDVCGDDSAGIVMIDQVSLEYVLTDGAPADVFSDAEFSILADLAESAVAAAAGESPESVVVWGFVTHTNEYVQGASALAPVEHTALDGLDGLLERLDPLVDSGMARWSTAAEIAARVR